MPTASESESEQAPPSAADASLIDEMLARSPEERLRHNDRMLRTIELLRQGLAEKTGEDGR
jgi:hypothetical protein